MLEFQFPMSTIKEAEGMSPFQDADEELFEELFLLDDLASIVTPPRMMAMVIMKIVIIFFIIARLFEFDCVVKLVILNRVTKNDRKYQIFKSSNIVF